jgi:DNA-binding response OmpR family regulator
MEEEIEKQGEQVLIIDDDPHGARLLCTLLSMEGLCPFEIEDWGNPLGDVEKHRPSMVIVDVRLRTRSGFDLLDQIRAHPDPSVASTIVIMMSAEDYRKQSRQAGADGFVAKPFDVPAMLEIIKSQEEDSL